MKRKKICLYWGLELNKSLIFDMDGTLVNSKKNITSSVNATRKMLGFEPISEDLIYKYINIPNENLALRFYNEDEFSPKTKKIFYDHYIQECVKDLVVYDGIRELLAYMYEKKVKMAIATNAYDLFAIKMMKSCGLDNYFDIIVGANTANSSKPDAKMITYILNSLHVNPEDTILIGDSQKDELCSLNAKTHFIFASWGYGDYESSLNACKSPKLLKDKILQIFPTLQKS